MHTRQAFTDTGLSITFYTICLACAHHHVNIFYHRTRFQEENDNGNCDGIEERTKNACDSYPVTSLGNSASLSNNVALSGETTPYR